MGSGTFDIAAGADDGYCYATSFDTSANAVKLGCYGVCVTQPCTMYARFQNVTIPPGEVITSAKLIFTCATAASKTVGVKIYFEAADSPAAPVSTADLAGRVRTGAYTSWSLAASLVKETTYDSDDIKGALQEVINRSGWASGQNLMAIVETSGSTDHHNYDFYSYDDTPAKAVQLYAEWGELETAKWNPLDLGDNISLDSTFLVATHA